ncbi:MAG TPA: oxygenase MpaB family protein [Candidatus Tectomicrobia bacterium]
MKHVYNMLPWLVGLLAGCAMMLSETTPPEVRQIIVPTSLDATYGRAQRTAARMGAVMLAENQAQHTFTAQLKRVIGLHVDVRQVETGTQMTVTGSILPHQQAIGILTEVDEFIVTYRKEGI